MLLTLVLLAATVLTVPAAETAFSDVPSDAWYADAVNYVRTAGIMSGTSQNAFSPEETMTRAMLVTVLHRIAGNPAAGSSADFTDVAPAAYYASAVAWAAEKGLAAGYGNGYFGAGDPVSRAQIATILWRYAGSPQAADSADFADEADIPAYAAAAVDWARANGIVNGKDGNRFDPQGNATRAQVAAILKNYLTLTADDTNPNPDADAGSRVLVAYYSASGNTERVAKAIADATGADLFEIVPETPYTSDDLNWTVSGSRVNREHEDEALRDIALTVTTPENFDKYDTVFIGYPIWWGIAAWPVDNFVKGNDFTGKTVIPFATSSSSGMGQSGSLLEGMANGGDWQSGQRFGSSASDSSVRTWAESLNLPKPTARPADASRTAAVAVKPRAHFRQQRVVADAVVGLVFQLVEQLGQRAQHLCIVVFGEIGRCVKCADQLLGHAAAKLNAAGLGKRFPTRRDQLRRLRRRQRQSLFRRQRIQRGDCLGRGGRKAARRKALQNKIGHDSAFTSKSRSAASCSAV